MPQERRRGQGEPGAEPAAQGPTDGVEDKGEQRYEVDGQRKGVLAGNRPEDLRVPAGNPNTERRSAT